MRLGWRSTCWGAAWLPLKRPLCHDCCNTGLTTPTPLPNLPLSSPPIAAEYLTFQKIVEADYELPEGLPPAAADFVSRLLVLEPADRIGERKTPTHLSYPTPPHPPTPQPRLGFGSHPHLNEPPGSPMQG